MTVRAVIAIGYNPEFRTMPVKQTGVFLMRHCFSDQYVQWDDFSTTNVPVTFKTVLQAYYLFYR